MIYEMEGMNFMINPNNRTEPRRSNGIDYVFEFLEDGWIAIYEYVDGLPLKPIIQACNIAKAEEYIFLRERLPAGVRRIC